jgi:transcriptional regulator with XRE-family HTH domain
MQKAKLAGLTAGLRSLRKRECITQGQLAKRMGVHRNTVSHMERFPQSITLGLFVEAASALREEPWKLLQNTIYAHDAVQD